MGHPAKLCDGDSIGFFDYSGCYCISHSVKVLLPVFYGGSFVPIPGQKVAVKLVEKIYSADYHQPISECSIAVDSKLLKIPVHLIGV